MQSRRLDDQRVSLPSMPGLHKEQETSTSGSDSSYLCYMVSKVQVSTVLRTEVLGRGVLWFLNFISCICRVLEWTTRGVRCHILSPRKSRVHQSRTVPALLVRPLLIPVQTWIVPGWERSQQKSRYTFRYTILENHWRLWGKEEKNSLFCCTSFQEIKNEKSMKGKFFDTAGFHWIGPGSLFQHDE